jgi:thiol:disulfide interchange protein DsbD
MMPYRLILRIFLLLVLFVPTVHAQEFLDPAVAFKPSAQALDGQTIEVVYAIADDYYLYRNKFRFAADSEAVTLGTPELPKGKEKDDDTFGKIEVYYKSVTIRLPVTRANSGELPLRLTLTSQGCADGGICYPPQQQTVNLVLPDPATTPSLAASPENTGDESGAIAAMLKNAGFWTIIAFFFAAGLVLSFTPCVLPMFPILFSIIVGQGQRASHARGFALSLA